MGGLPHHQASLNFADAHGTRYPGRHSVAEALHIRAFDKRDQVVLPGNDIDLLDDRAIQLHVAKFADQFLDPAWLGFDQNVSVNQINLSLFILT